MQKYEELLIFCSSLVIQSLISLDNANNVLAQPLPDSYDLSGSLATSSKSDVELIEDRINGQKQTNELEEIESELPIRTDGSNHDDSASIIDKSNRNSDNHNDNETSDVNDYNKPMSDREEEAGGQREISLVDDDRKDSHSSSDAGGVYMVDYMNIRIQKFDSNGDFITKWGSEGKGDGEFGVPHGIAVDSSSGNVYVVDMNKCNVQVFDSKVRLTIPCIQ